MIIRPPERKELQRLQAVAEYQFNAPIGECLFKNGVKLGVVSGGRIRYVYIGDELAFVLRPSDGLFSLHLAGGKALHSCLPYPLQRVVVSDEASPYVCRGSNVFAGHVTLVDQGIRAGDEVLVVSGGDELLAVGKARLSAVEIYYFQRGEAVRVRKGACSGQ